MSQVWQRLGHGWGLMLRALAVLLVIAAGLTLSGPSASAKGKSSGDDGPACDKPAKSDDDAADDDDDDDDKDATGLTYKLGALCLGVSGDVQATGQASRVNEPRFGTPSNSSRSITVKPDIRIESALPTPLGKFKTAFEIDWSYVSSTGPEQVPNLDEATANFLGLTVGYSDSLMNFWDSSDFQFTASAPNRSTYLVSYERSLGDELKLAAAIEAGPPSSRGAESWQLPETPPYFTGRLRYEKDDWTLHASGAYHQLETRAPPLLMGPLQRADGWAASAGVTIPLALMHEDDSATIQATYAVNSSVFLGTQTDVSFLASVVPRTGPAAGWSILASAVHNWTDKLKSNFFVSKLALAMDLERAHPSVRTTRAGANLSYDITDHWQAGAEIDYVSARFELDGTFGLINGRNLSGPTGYLWIKWQF